MVAIFDFGFKFFLLDILEGIFNDLPWSLEAVRHIRDQLYLNLFHYFLPFLIKKLSNMVPYCRITKTFF